MEPTIRKVVDGDLASFRIAPGQPDGARAHEGHNDDFSPKCILPGSFNPLHPGHLAMARFAKNRIGSPTEFELSVANVDKPSLSVEQVVARVEQFRDAAVWLTRASTFVEKAQLFPKCCFVIGADTALRLFDEKYYSAEASVEMAIDSFHQQACRFLVFGRIVGDRFVDASSLPFPDQAARLMDFVPEMKFRVDVSSTEMRAKRERN